MNDKNTEYGVSFNESEYTSSSQKGDRLFNVDVSNAVNELLCIYLTEEELKLVQEYAAQINLADVSCIELYGADIQKKISSLFDDILANVRNDELRDIGDMLRALDHDKKTDNKTNRNSRFFIKKHHNAIRTKYTNVSMCVEEITSNLKMYLLQLLEEASAFNRFYDMNLEYMRQLTIFIVAGERCLEEVRRTSLLEQQKNDTNSKNSIDEQHANDMDAQCDCFEKKLYDLKFTRTVSIQMAPQICILRNNIIQMVERIQSSLSKWCYE